MNSGEFAFMAATSWSSRALRIWKIAAVGRPMSRAVCSQVNSSRSRYILGVIEADGWSPLRRSTIESRGSWFPQGPVLGAQSRMVARTPFRATSSRQYSGGERINTGGGGDGDGVRQTTCPELSLARPLSHFRERSSGLRSMYRHILSKSTTRPLMISSDGFPTASLWAFRRMASRTSSSLSFLSMPQARILFLNMLRLFRY